MTSLVVLNLLIPRFHTNNTQIQLRFLTCQVNTPYTIGSYFLRAKMFPSLIYFDSHNNMFPTVYTNSPN